MTLQKIFRFFLRVAKPKTKCKESNYNLQRALEVTFLAIWKAFGTRVPLISYASNDDGVRLGSVIMILFEGIIPTGGLLKKS